MFVSSFWSQARPTLALALPIIAGQMAQMLMGLVDSAMVGRVGVIPLAAAAFANTLISVPLVFGIGLMLALSIRISQVRGAQGDENADQTIAELLRHGVFLSIVAGVALAFRYGFAAIISINSARAPPLPSNRTRFCCGLAPRFRSFC